MNTNTSSPDPNQLPKILLFITAICVPGAAAFRFADIVSKDPGRALIISLIYEGVVFFFSFGRKVWTQIEGKWIQNTVKWLNDPFQRKSRKYKSYYARFLTVKHRYFDFKGLNSQSPYTLELDQVFVNLSIDPILSWDQVSLNPIPSQIPKELPGIYSLWHYLAAEEWKNQHFVILGVPGSGKTTLFKHLALTLVNSQKMRALPQEIKDDYRLPFLLFLSDYAETIYTNPSLSLVEAIQTLFNECEQPPPEGWVRQQLRKGKCLILLEGLDEVGETSLRKGVVKWIQLQMERYATNRFLISSRPFGYKSNPLKGAVLQRVS